MLYNEKVDRRDVVKRYRTLIFDADQTLLDFKKNEAHALPAVFQKHHIELSEEIKDAIVEVSKYSTLKNGDIIAVMLSDEPIGIEQNTTISIDLNDENVVKFNIK